MSLRFRLFRPGRRIGGQVFRFALVGVINTFVDIGLLNLLSQLTGSYHGTSIFGLNTISYSVATINSYILNKRWTFDDRERSHQVMKFSAFVTINIIGALVNSGIVSGMSTFIAPPAGLAAAAAAFLHQAGIGAISPPVLWMNISKLTATAVVMTGNFILYRYFVFHPGRNRRATPQSSISRRRASP